MRDVKNQELISAYLDGELTVDERLQVERLLAESADSQRYLEQLRRQRTAVRNIPRPQLTIDLSERVLRAIEQTRPSPAGMIPAAAQVSAAQVSRGELTSPASRAGQQEKWRTWQGVVTAGGVVAVLLAGLFWISRLGPGPGPGLRPNELVGPLVQPGDPDAPSVPPRDGPAVDDTLTSETQLALNEFQQLVQYVTIFDITVDPQGQRDRLIPAWMAKHGIPVNKGILVDRRLSQQILQARFIGSQRVVAGTNSADVRQEVEMLFVRGTLKQIDGVFREYQAIRGQPNPSVQIRLDMAVAPAELNVFLQLNRAAGVDVAAMKSDPSLLRTAGAFPLQFEQRLFSAASRSSGASDSLALTDDLPAQTGLAVAGFAVAGLASAGLATAGLADAGLVDAGQFLAMANEKEIGSLTVAQGTGAQGTGAQGAEAQGTGQNAAQNPAVGVGGQGPESLPSWRDPEQAAQAIFIIRNVRALPPQ